MPRSSPEATMTAAATPASVHRRKKSSANNNIVVAATQQRSTPVTAARPRRRKQPTTTAASSSSSSQRRQGDDFMEGFSSSAMDYSFVARDNKDSGGIADGKVSKTKAAANTKKGASSRNGSKSATKKSALAASTDKTLESQLHNNIIIDKENNVNDRKYESGRNRVSKDDNSRRERSANAVGEKDHSNYPNPSNDDLSNLMAKVTISASTTTTTATTTEKVIKPKKAAEATQTSTVREETKAKRVVERQEFSFPPIGYGTKNITASLTTDVDGDDDTDAQQILSKSIKIAEANGEASSMCKVFQTPCLVEAVASASFASGGSGGSILLDENVLKLIDASKKCLRMLSSSSNSKEEKSNKSETKGDFDLALLRIAVFSLRSILPSLESSGSSSSKSQSNTCQVVTKLFYHCVVIAGDGCHQKFQSFHSSSPSSSLDEGDYSIVLQYAMICLASYEGLGRLLRTFSWPGFQCSYLDKRAKQSKTMQQQLSWDEMLPVPLIGNGKDDTATSNRSDSKKAEINLPHRQIVKIILESSLCAASSFLHLSLASLHMGIRKNKQLVVPNEFKFTPAVILESCSGELKCTPIFKRLMTNVVLPYIVDSLLTAEVEGEKSSLFNGDAIRHVKRVFRILWDGARCVEGICSIKDVQDLRISCLNIQSDAIIFLLQCLKVIFDQSPTVMKELSSSEAFELTSLFDRASSSAMKSSGIFEKMSEVLPSTSNTKSNDLLEQRRKDELLYFHSTVGAELDEIAKHFYSASCAKNFLPSSYFEYCTYRSIHQWRLFAFDEKTQMPIPLLYTIPVQKKEDIESLVGMATFSVVFLAIQSQCGLVAKETIAESSATICEKIVTHFEQVVLRNAPVASQNRCRSMISMLDLPRVASKLIASAGSDLEIYSGKGMYLAAIGYIMGRCLAPLETMLAHATKEPSRSLIYQLSASDNYSKSAALLDIALDSSVTESKDQKETYSFQVDKQLKKSYAILIPMIDPMNGSDVTGKSPLVMSVEIFAKAATFVSKRRSIRKELSSLQPQINASEILLMVASKSSNHNFFGKFQLSSRFMMMATAFEADGNFAESCVALSLAAWVAIERSARTEPHGSIESDDYGSTEASENILLFPGNGIIDPASSQNEFIVADGFSSIINRLTRAYIEHLRVLHNTSADECTPRNYISRALEKTLAGNILNSAFCNQKRHLSLSTLLNGIVWNERQNQSLSFTQLSDTIQEILKCSTKVMKCLLDSNDGTSLPILSNVVEEQHLFLQSQIDRLEESMPQHLLQKISSCFRVAYAGFLLDSRFLYFPPSSSWALNKVHIGDFDETLLGHSCEQLHASEESFAAALNDENDSTQDATFFAQWAAVQLQHAIFHEHHMLATAFNESENQDSKSHSEIIDLVMQQYSSALSISSHVVERLDDSEAELSLSVLQSLVSTIKRICCRFNHHGDPISSTHCFVLLQKIYSILALPSSVLEAVSDFIAIASKFEDLSPILMNNSIFHGRYEAESMLNEGVRDLFDHCTLSQPQLDLAVSHVLDSISNISRAVSDECIELDSVCQSIKSLQLISDIVELGSQIIFDNAENEQKDSSTNCGKIVSFTQMQSLVALSLMLNAKILITNNKPANAIQFLISCRCESRKLIKLIRFASSHIKNVLLDDMAIQADNMIVMCYERMAAAFSLLGIRRKAEDCAFSAVLKQKILNTDQPMISRISLQDLNMLIEHHGDFAGFLTSIRSLIKVKALSMSPDQIALVPILQPNMTCATDLDLGDGNTQCINKVVGVARTILTYTVVYEHVASLRENTYAQLNEVYCLHTELNALVCKESLVNVPLTTFTTSTDIELQLKKALHPDKSGVNSLSEESASMNDIAESSSSPSSCRAEAYYRLGLHALTFAKKNGELTFLWKNHSIFAREDDDTMDTDDPSLLTNIIRAREYFLRAWIHAAPASDYLTKRILRSLALVTGPDRELSEVGFSTSSLIHTSIGGASRNLVVDALSRNTESASRVKDFFEAFDTDVSCAAARNAAVGKLFQNAATLIPRSWNISAMALCPTGEILVSSLNVKVNDVGERITQVSTVCIFPESMTMRTENSRNSIHSNLLIPLDRIIDRSQKQLSGMSEEAQNEEYNEESVRRKWWKERHRIDEDLESLLKSAESTYFGRGLIRERLLPSDVACNQTQPYSSSDDDSSECSDFGPGNLSSRFDAVERECSDVFDEERERSNLQKLTVAGIKERFNTVGYEGKKLTKLRKAELIELLLSIMKESYQPMQIEEEAKDPEPSQAYDIPLPSLDRNDHKSDDECCTILILDEHLHRFPFESMPMFENKAVTRVPSLPFILASLYETKSDNSRTIPNVNPSKVKYVLDPESNLSETALTLGPALDSLASRNGWDWASVIGKMPSLDFMSEALTMDDGLFLYCGHGGGEKAISRSKIEDMMVANDEHDSNEASLSRSQDIKQLCRGCRSAVVLMGCSSGKLHSVNTPRDTPDGNVHPILYEPEGIALSYLFAGAPCVVGNLWDVTDRDIDRYCLTLMEDFLGKAKDDSSGRSPSCLAKCVSDARRACKLRYIVGSAPVCYGIPVKRKV